MRRWFLRWLKTQWTAVPLAFLIVTAIEIWRTDDKGDVGRNCRETGELGNKALLADVINLPSVRPPSTTKQPPKTGPKSTAEKQESRENVGGAAAGPLNMTGRNRPWRKYGQAEIEVNTSRPVVNPHPFKYVINCPDLCRDADVFLLNYVHTAVSHFGRRARIRKTWALQSHYRNSSIRTVFFVGISEKTAWYQEALYYESRKYGDIVQKNFIDTYKLVSLIRPHRTHEMRTAAMRLRCANMAERIEILPGVETHGHLRNIVLDGGPDFCPRIRCGYRQITAAPLRPRDCVYFCCPTQ